MITVLQNMIANMEGDDYYNLTNSVYFELIEQLLKQYITSFEEAGNSGGTDPEHDDFATSSTDKYLQIEKLLFKLFYLYNQDKFNNDENEELKWLLENINYNIGKGDYHENYA